MDLTNFTSTFGYASAKAERSIGSANDIRKISKRIYEPSVGSSMLSMIRKTVGIESPQTSQARDMIQKNAQTLRLRNTAKSMNVRVGASDYDTLEGLSKTFRKTMNTPQASKPVYSTFMSRNNDVMFNGMINKAKSDAVKKTSEATSDIAKNVLADTKIATKAAGKEAAEGAAKKVGKSLLDKAIDMKIPQIALGVGVTAWLVNKLSDSRGQQSNAQLYGQQGY